MLVLRSLALAAVCLIGCTNCTAHAPSTSAPAVTHLEPGELTFDPEPLGWSFDLELEAPAPTLPEDPCQIPVREFDATSVEHVLGAIQQRVDEGEDVIPIQINSFGGSVFGGLDLMQGMDEHRKRGVTFICTVDSKAMSMGFVLLQGPCDVRQATPRSTLLAHNASLRETGGNANELLESVEILEALDDGMAEIVATRMGLSVEEYELILSTRAWTMSARMGLAENALDDLVDPLSTLPVCW